MVSHYGVFFEKDIPTIDTIVTDLKKVTGIDVQYLEDSWEIINPNDSTDGFSIYYQNYNGIDGITLTVFHLEMNYLLGATLYVLISLGGNYGHSLPEWSSLKWEDYIHNLDNPQ